MSSSSNSNKSTTEGGKFLAPVQESAAFKSMESLYSSSSSKFSTVNLQRRKQTNGYPNINRFTSANPIQQRVISARALRTKSLQSQLTMAHQQLAELENENRLLKQLLNKNNFALARYESSNAELPRLLHSHQEEVRVLTTKCKNLQITNKDLAQKLKQKDSIILGITDQNRHLTQLNKDKNLEERHRLTDRCRELEQRLVEKDNEYKLLTRRLQLETKNSRTHSLQEASKVRELTTKLEKANFELKRLTAITTSTEKLDTLDGMASEYSGFRGRDLRKNRSTSYLNGGSSKIPILEQIVEKKNKLLLLPIKTVEKPKFVSCRQDTEMTDGTMDSDSDRKEIMGDNKNGIANLSDLDDGADSDDADSTISQSSFDQNLNDVYRNDDYKNPQQSISEIQVQKQQLVEIEAKLKSKEQLTLENDSFQSVIDQQFKKNFNAINDMKNEIRESILQKEQILESICQTAVGDTAGMNTLPMKFPKPKRQNIDPKKKDKLLAALKAIDGHESLDK